MQYELKLNENLRQLRKKRGISQKNLCKELAAFMGGDKIISPSAMCSWETGEKKPPYETLLAFSDFYGVSTDYLLGNSIDQLAEDDSKDSEVEDQIVIKQEQKQTADSEMMDWWRRYIYEETMNGSPTDYRHLDGIIRNDGFIKKYVRCEGRISVYWIFILCEGEYGYFDGFKYSRSIPISIAKLLDVEQFLKRKEFQIKDGCYELNLNSLSSHA